MDIINTIQNIMKDITTYPRNSANDREENKCEKFLLFLGPGPKRLKWHR
jgi:hypothetical protein